MHPCEIVYNAANTFIQYGDTQGVCCITGKVGIGHPFKKWVKDTFTNLDVLYQGEIISNEAIFCFEEKSELIQSKTGRDKPQKFRSYCHIVTNENQWICLTKADKQKIVCILQQSPMLVCLTDSGQKHVLFKNKPPFWQLDDSHVMPNIVDFNFLHSTMMELLELGFSQTEIKTGKYYHSRILSVGISLWQNLEDKISQRRGEPIFDFAAWLMYSK